jgi:hypothetical protein
VRADDPFGYAFEQFMRIAHERGERERSRIAEEQDRRRWIAGVKQRLGLVTVQEARQS